MNSNGSHALFDQSPDPTLSPSAVASPEPWRSLRWVVALPAALVLATHMVIHLWGGVAFDGRRFWLPAALGMWVGLLAVREARIGSRFARKEEELRRVREDYLELALQVEQRSGESTGAVVVRPARGAPTLGDDASVAEVRAHAAEICDQVLNEIYDPVLSEIGPVNTLRCAECGLATRESRRE